MNKPIRHKIFQGRSFSFNVICRLMLDQEGRFRFKKMKSKPIIIVKLVDIYLVFYMGIST